MQSSPTTAHVLLAPCITAPPASVMVVGVLCSAVFSAQVQRYARYVTHQKTSNCLLRWDANALWEIVTTQAVVPASQCVVTVNSSAAKLVMTVTLSMETDAAHSVLSKHITRAL